MRGERWLLRAGEYLVGRACRRLPPDVREERYREWAAELPVIMHDHQVRFAPWRAVRMLGYAADTLRGTAMTSARISGAMARSRLAGLLVGIFLAQFVAVSILVVVLAPGDGQHYLWLVMALLAAAYFTCRVVHAPERMTTVLLFTTALAFQVFTFWQVAQAPGDWVNYFWATALGLTLLTALLSALRVRWVRRLLARARRA